MDREEGLLFYPDPCFLGPSNPTCERGVYVFDAYGGAPAATAPIEVGFAPIEVVVSR